MADPTLQDKVTALLSRSSAGNSKSNTTVDGAVTFESIIIKMLLYPRVVPYFGFMAANGLNAAITAELKICDDLIKAINDLNNPSPTVDDTSELEAASNSLIQLDGSAFDGSSPGLQGFNNGVDRFLDGPIKGGVVREGGLVRPSVEAEGVIPSLYSSLVDAHSSVLTRITALSVGVDNFSRIPFTAVIGQSVVARIKASIDQVIANFTSDPTAAGARDAVLSLLAGKASLRMIGAIPDPYAAVIDSSKQLPPGYGIKAKTAFSSPVLTTLAGPTLPTSASLTIGSSLGSYTKSSFPHDGVNMGSRACLYGLVVGSSVAFPSSPGANLYLLFDNGTKTYRRFNFTGTVSMATILSSLSSGMGALGVAVEFGGAGSGRIAVVPAAGYKVSVVSFDNSTPPTTGTVGASGYLGFEMGQYANPGPVSGILLFDALRFIATHHLPALQVSMVGADRVKIFINDGSPTAFLSLSGTATLPLFGQSTITTNGATDKFSLFGTIGTTPTDPINPLLLLQKNDSVKLGSNPAQKIKDVSSTQVTLTAPVKAFTGNITVTAAVGALWKTFSYKLKVLTPTLLTSPFGKNLLKVRLALSGLSRTSSKAKIDGTVELIMSLKDVLTPVSDALALAVLPASTGGFERTAAREIINTLTEKKYDKALDLLLQAQFDKLLGLTSETASYGGSLLRATADVGAQDTTKVDPAKVEDQDPDGNASPNTGRGGKRRDL